MHTRRAFLKHVSILTAGFPAVAKTETGQGARSALLDRIGVGLFTIPTMVEKDFAGTMKVLASIGYKEIETFGPYSWSAQVAQDRWRVTSQSLAFKGSGYFGLTPAAVRRILDDHGLTSPSMHTDLDSLRTRLEPMAEAARVLGQRYVVLPSIPASERQSLDGYRHMADAFNQIGAQAAKLGMRFTYHNHGYGLKPVDGIVPRMQRGDDGDARQAPASAPDRPAPGRAGDLEPVATRGDARGRRRDGDAGHGQP